MSSYLGQGLLTRMHLMGLAGIPTLASRPARTAPQAVGATSSVPQQATAAETVAPPVAPVLAPTGLGVQRQQQATAP